VVLYCNVLGSFESNHILSDRLPYYSTANFFFGLNKEPKDLGIQIAAGLFSAAARAESRFKLQITLFLDNFISSLNVF